MSTESNEQYRAGFEAWMQDEYKSVAALFLERTQSGLYKDGRTDDKWRAWTASKREASTEPSAISGAGQNGGKTAETRMDASFEVLDKSAGALSDDAKDAARLDWLDQHIYHREMDEWDKRMMSGHRMWVMFAPDTVQGAARNIIDAAIKAHNMEQKS